MTDKPITVYRVKKSHSEPFRSSVGATPHIAYHVLPGGGFLPHKLNSSGIPLQTFFGRSLRRRSSSVSAQSPYGWCLPTERTAVGSQNARIPTSEA